MRFLGNTKNASMLNPYKKEYILDSTNLTILLTESALLVFQFDFFFEKQ